MEAPVIARGKRIRTRTLVGAAVALLGATSLGGYLVGKAGRFTPSRADAAATPLVERRDPEAPSWAPTRAFRLPTLGSIFRNRFATSDSPLEGVEAILLSSRPEECLDTCPLGLRLIGGERGEALNGEIVDSLGPNVDVLAGAPGLPPRLAEWLREGHAAFSRHQGRARAEETSAPLRAFIVGMPRPDLGPATWSVGLGLYDTVDHHFDREGGPTSGHGGRMLLVSRVERSVEGSRVPRLMTGAVEIGRAPDGRPMRAIPPSGSELGGVFGSLWGHFDGVPEEIAGLYLTSDGTVLAFGPDLQLYRLPQSPELTKALTSILMRA